MRVTHAAVTAVVRWHERAARARRQGSLERAFARGKLGVDVLTRPLFAYQREGAARLVAAGRALLADDMGLGKTVQALAACQTLRARGEASSVLVVTAASLKHQWAQEIQSVFGVRSGYAASNRAILASELT